MKSWKCKPKFRLVLRVKRSKKELFQKASVEQDASASAQPQVSKRKPMSVLDAQQWGRWLPGSTWFWQWNSEEWGTRILEKNLLQGKITHSNGGRKIQQGSIPWLFIPLRPRNIYSIWTSLFSSWEHFNKKESKPDLRACRRAHSTPTM